jgi:hypothetical protein
LNEDKRTKGFDSNDKSNKPIPKVSNSRVTPTKTKILAEKEIISNHLCLASEYLQNVNANFELLNNYKGKSTDNRYSSLRNEIKHDTESFLKYLKLSDSHLNEIFSNKHNIHFELKRKQIRNKLKSFKSRKSLRIVKNKKGFNHFQFSNKITKSFMGKSQRKVKENQSETSQSWKSCSFSFQSDQKFNPKSLDYVEIFNNTQTNEQNPDENFQLTRNSDKKIYNQNQSIPSITYVSDAISNNKASEYTLLLDHDLKKSSSKEMKHKTQFLPPKRSVQSIKADIFEKVSKESQVFSSRQHSTLRLIEIFSTENDLLKPEYKQSEMEYDPTEKLIEGYSRVIKGKLKLPRSILDVAIKIPSMPESNEERLKLHKNLIHEIKITRKLGHKNVVKFIGTMRLDNDCACMLTEWHDGCDLNQFYSELYFVYEFYLKATMFDLGDVLAQIAKGFVFIHGKNVIHRDLKSANVFIGRHRNMNEPRRRWAVKIGDFGLAVDNVVDSVYQDESLVGTCHW